MDSTASLERIEPRPEARPLAWTAMTLEQQEATRRLGVLLRNLAEQKFSPLVPQQGIERFLPPIDEQRKNHVFLLDGGRGSGKTALLVTHLSVWAWGVRREGSRQTTENAPDKNLQDALEPLGQIVPVGLLDLQPLPDSANLLTYVVTRFKRIVEAIESCTGHEGTRAAWHAAGPEALHCATEWQHFLNAAAAGWDGALTNRRAHADPATFAVEFEQAEEQRLDVVSSFRRFIDALVADYPRIGRLPKDKPPLFVLGIDDADMNVAKSAELLDVVRTLWHPRVAFLLTGESRLFRAALEVRAQNDLVKSSHGSPSAPNSLTRTLPRDIYDKVLPPLHRLELRSLSANERELFLNRWFHARTNPEDQKRIARVTALFERYPSLKYALPARLRPLQDFELWVIGIYNHGKPIDDGVVEARVLHYLWKYALDDAGSPADIEPWVTEDDERRIVVRIDSANRFQFSTHFQPLISARNSRIEVSLGPTIDLHDAHDALIPDNLVACLLPLLDMSSDQQCQHIRTLFAPSLDTDHSVVVMARVGDALPWIPWYLPKWSRFIDWFNFAKRWNRHLDELRQKNQQDTATLALAYLDAVVGNESPEPPHSSDPWQKRALRLKALIKERSADAALIRWAIAEAPFLAAPESGLAIEDANAWMSAVRSIYSDDEWQALRGRLVASRHSRLQSVLTANPIPRGDEFDIFDQHGAKQLEHYLNEVQKRFAEHLWFTVVERDPTATANAFAARIGQIYLPGERSAGTLLNYLPMTRLRELLSADVTTLGRMHNALESLTQQRGQTGVPAIEILWRIMTKDKPSALQEAVAYRGRLEFNFAKAYACTGRPALTADMRDLGQVFNSNGSDDIPIRICPGQIIWEPDKQIDAPTLAILRMVWDIESDTNLRDISPFAPWWPLAKGIVRQEWHHEYPWPAVSWPTFLDWERAIDAWKQKVLSPMANLTAQLTNAGGSVEVLFDSVGYWYVSMIAHVIHDRCDLDHMNFSIQSDPSRWQNDIRGWVNGKQSHTNTTSAHRRAFHEWLDRIGLLAAPESGLSRAVAENILAGFPDLTQRRESLRKLRRERLAYMGVPAEFGEGNLRSIDYAFPDHPWTRLIEEPLRLPPATSEGSSGS